MRILWHFFNMNHSDINIDECGIQQFNPNYSYEYIAYQNFILHYVEEGEGTYKVDGKEYHLKHGDGFIIRKGMKVTYTADSEKPWKNYWVGLSGEQLNNYLKNTYLSKSDVLTFKESSESVSLIKNICEKTLSESPTVAKDPWYLGQIYHLLYQLSKEFKLTENFQIESKEEHQNYAKIAFDYIYNNYMYPITIQEIADYIGINRSYLYRTFKAAYDISPQQFLLNYRMGKAKKFLANTNDHVYLIAEKVGYFDQLQFSKAFKKCYKVSPINFRKSLNHSLEEKEQ